MFTVSTNDIKDKIMLSENNFELQSGQSKDVFLYITADCSKGSDDLKITVTSNLGVQKTIAKSITRDRCQNVAVYVSNYTSDINPCQTKSIEIFVQNIGPFKEDYTLSSNYDKYISYNINKFTLDPNQAQKAVATIKFDCSMYGSQNIIFSAHSVNNRLTASISTPLNILQNYDYDIRFNGDINDTVSAWVCNRMYSTQFPVTITNKGAVGNNYTIDFKDLPRFAKVVGIDGNRFSLNPQESKTFIIDVDSTSYRLEYKTFKSIITVTSQFGDIVKSKNIAINLMPCYEHKVSIDKMGNIEKHPLETCSGYIYTYNTNIANNGRYKENITISLDTNVTSASLSKNKTTIDPGKSDSVKLILIGPESNGLYSIDVNAKLGNGIPESDTLWIKAYDQASCHKIDIDKTQYSVNYQTQNIIVKLTDKGIVGGKYIATWNGSRILGLDDTELDMNVSEPEKIIFNVNSKNMSEGYYTGKLIIKNTDSNAVYAEDMTVRLKDKSILVKSFEYLAYDGVCRQFSMYGLLAILLVILLIILFLIKGPKYPYKFSNRLKAKIPVIIILMVIFLLGAVLVIMFAGLPKTQSQVYNLTTNTSELRYEWLQDNSYTLDVGAFFYDPENTTMRFSVSGLKHIKAIVDAKSVTFYPDLGWSGIEYAQVTATDSVGGNVTSPDMTLIVRNIPKKSFTEIYNIYCWYMNLAIFAILLTFIFIAVFVKQKKRVRK